MYQEHSTNLNIIIWINVALDIAFALSWKENGFFETPTLLLLLIVIIAMIWGFYVFKSEKKEKELSKNIDE